MDIYTALKVSTIAISVLIIAGIGLFCFWFHLEKKLVKYDESSLFKSKKK